MKDKAKITVGVITGIWIIAFMLGVRGYWVLDSNHTETVSDYIYHALQLFTLDGSWEAGTPVLSAIKADNATFALNAGE